MTKETGVHYKCDLCYKKESEDYVNSWWSNIDGKNICQTCVETVQRIEWNGLLIPIAVLIRLEKLGYTCEATKRYSGSTKAKDVQSLISELQSEADKMVLELQSDPSKSSPANKKATTNS